MLGDLVSETARICHRVHVGVSIVCHVISHVICQPRSLERQQFFRPAMEVAVERAQAPPCPNEPSSILVSLHVWERLGLSEDSSTVALRDPATGASVFATARCNVDGGFNDAVRFTSLIVACSLKGIQQTMSHCVAWATLLEDADIPAWLSTLSVSAVTPVELDSILLVLSADASISTDGAHHA